MKASITTILLLLFVPLHWAHDIKWEECDDTAYCQEMSSEDCLNLKDTLQVITASSIRKRNPPLPYCNIGVHIKPESTKKWTISIINDKWKATDSLHWMIGAAKVFKCVQNAASSEDGRLYVNTISTQATKGTFLCIFTVSTVESDKMVSTVLEAIKAEQAMKSIPADTELHSKSNLAIDIPYSSVNKKMRCDGTTLFNENACDEKTEDCTKVKNEESWGCQDGYISRYRNADGDYETSKIKCINGGFIRRFNNSENKIETRDVEAGSTAKCARRKCAQCKAKTNFTSLLKVKEAADFACTTLECDSGYNMVINGTKGVIAVKSDIPVMCSDKTIVKPNKDSEEKHARWVVDGHDEVVINTAVCMETIPCDQINQLETDCGSSENCVEAQFNADTQVHECTNGTAHVFVNKADIPIKQPVCTEGKWIITTENSTEPLHFNSGDQITIKCIYEPVIGQKSSPPAKSGGFPIWIIFVIVFIVLLTIGIVIATYFYRKGRAAKKTSMVSKTSKTSKTPSSSNQSGNPPTSSGEKEPLTSAIGNSITGDSLHTAIPTKPTVVLAKADLRASTAAVSSDTSTNKEKKKKRDIKESIPDLDDADEKKREKTCASDETSKKWKKSDMTSTKEKLAPMPGSTDDALKSQTGGDGESQVSTKKNQESAKLLPNNRATPRKYSKSSTKGKEASKKSSNKEFLNLTDSDEDEPSKTGSKRKGKKRK